MLNKVEIDYDLPPHFGNTVRAYIRAAVKNMGENLVIGNYCLYYSGLKAEDEEGKKMIYGFCVSRVSKYFNPLDRMDASVSTVVTFQENITEALKYLIYSVRKDKQKNAGLRKASR